MKYEELLLPKSKNPYKEGYCLVAYLPNKALEATLNAMSTEVIKKHGVVIAESSNKSFRSIWAIRNYGLMKYTKLPEVRRLCLQWERKRRG